MITKELLSLVLNKHIAEKDVIKIVENDLYIFYDESIKIERVNLDTLGRLCKEWCANQKVSIASGKDKSHFCFIRNNEIDTSFDENTELEAIIKATNWVAKEKGLLND